MVIDDFHIVGIPIAPQEADSPSVINTNAELSFPVAVKGLQPIARRRSQVAYLCGDIQLAEFALRHAPEFMKPLYTLSGMKLLCLPRPERLNHETIL